MLRMRFKAMQTPSGPSPLLRALQEEDEAKLSRGSTREGVHHLEMVNDILSGISQEGEWGMPQSRRAVLEHGWMNFGTDFFIPVFVKFYFDPIEKFRLFEMKFFAFLDCMQWEGGEG